MDITEFRAIFPEYNDMPDAWVQQRLQIITPNDQRRIDERRAQQTPQGAPVLGGAPGGAPALTGAEAGRLRVDNPAAPRFMDYLTTGVDNLLEGIPVIGPPLHDLTQNAAGFVRSQVQGTQFEDEMTDIRRQEQLLNEAHPGLATGAQITGAVLGMAPFVLAMPGAFGLTQATTGGRAVASALGGVGLGALDTGVRTEWNPAAMGIGGAVGGVVGAAAPYIASGAGRAFVAARDRLMTGGAARRTGLAANVADPLRAAAGSENLTGPDLARRLIEAGPEGMLADVNPQFRALTSELARAGGPGAEVVTLRLGERAAAASQRVARAADAALGTEQDLPRLSATLIMAREAEAAPLYDAAYMRFLPGLSQMPETAAALQTEFGQRAWTRAARLAEAEGVAIDIEAPTVRALDLWQRELSTMAREADNAARTTGTNEARILGGMRDRVIGEVDGLVPEFAQARSAFAGRSAMLDAIEEGAQVFARSLSPADLRVYLSTLSQSEQAAYATGARAALAEVLQSASNDRLAAERLFSRLGNVEKMRTLIGDDATLQLVRAFGYESVYNLTERGVTNAANARAREAAEAAIRPQPIGANLRPTTMTGLGLDVAARGVNAVRTAGRVADIDLRNLTIADILTLPAGREREQVVNLLFEEMSRGGQINPEVRNLLQMGSTGFLIQGAPMLATGVAER